MCMTGIQRFSYLKEYEALISSFGGSHEDREARLYRYSAADGRCFFSISFWAQKPVDHFPTTRIAGAVGKWSVVFLGQISKKKMRFKIFSHSGDHFQVGVGSKLFFCLFFQISI